MAVTLYPGRDATYSYLANGTYLGFQTDLLAPAPAQNNAAALHHARRLRDKPKPKRIELHVPEVEIIDASPRVWLYDDDEELLLLI